MVLKTTELIQHVRSRHQIAQSQQKSYVDKSRSDLEFQVRDMVLLKVSPGKGVIQFRKRGKLGHMYIGPFRILAWVGQVAYCLDLLVELSQIHRTSQLRKFLVDDFVVVPLEDIQMGNRLNYIERRFLIGRRKPSGTS